MIERTHVGRAIALVMLGGAALGCGEQADDRERVTFALSGQVPIAFKATFNTLWIDPNGPGSGVNTGAVMAANTVPCRNSASKVGFQGGNGHFWVGPVGSFNDTGGAMAAGTSPSIVATSGGLIGFAFQGTNGHVWMGNSPNGTLGQDLPEPMASGASPAISTNSSGNSLSHAYRGPGNFLYVGTNGGFASQTSAILAAGTNPTISQTLNGTIVVAFQGSNGHLWVIPNYPAVGFDTNISMKAGTSPAAANRTTPGANSGTTDIAFQASDNTLQVCTNTGGNSCSTAVTGIFMTSGFSPGIVSTGTSYETWGKGTNNKLWAFIPGQLAEDQGLQM